MANIVDSAPNRRLGWRQLLRVSLAVLGLISCYRLIEDAARSGVSRLFSTTAIIQARVEAADEAVRLAPSDPEAHYTRALALVNLERLSDAVVELEEATRLRPYHYYEWLDLGVTLDRLGDQTRAAAAIRESVRLAPSFAQPRWQLGNLLFRQARYEEAFGELRLGAKSNPGLFQGMLGLAWVAAEGNVATMELLVQPQSKRTHLEFAAFLARLGKGSDAVRQVTEAGDPGDEIDRALFRETISRLLAARLFSDAYAAWANGYKAARNVGAKGPGQFVNGNFSEPIMQNEPGFGWQVPNTPAVSISIDPAGPEPDARSARVEFSGDSAPAIQPISQLILLQPNTRYSLSFVSRAENLVTGGPPVIRAFDGASTETKILSQSTPLSPGTSGWTAYQVEFTTDENTTAVIVALQRLGCSQSPCPIFGKLWLSKFSLVRN